MGLESASYVQDLVATNPVAGDFVAQGDDHLRLIKTALKNSFPKDMRGVAASAVGQHLEYDGTSFVNKYAGPVLSVWNAAGFTIPTGTTDYFSWDNEALDVYNMFAPTSASITIPAALGKFQADLFIACYNNFASKGFYVSLLNDTAGASRQPFLNPVTVPQIEGGYNTGTWGFLGTISLGKFLAPGRSWPNASDVLKLQYTSNQGGTITVVAAALHISRIPSNA